VVAKEEAMTNNQEEALALSLIELDDIVGLIEDVINFWGPSMHDDAVIELVRIRRQAIDRVLRKYHADWTDDGVGFGAR
jgi:hypothetical protein